MVDGPCNDNRMAILRQQCPGFGYPGRLASVAGKQKMVWTRVRHSLQVLVSSQAVADPARNKNIVTLAIPVPACVKLHA